MENRGYVIPPAAPYLESALTGKLINEATGVAIPTEDLTATDATIVDVRSCDAILLVCDIQGFTTLAVKLEPDQLAPIIGSWYAITE
jgi:class 3 adenylate cyclase